MTLTWTSADGQASIPMGDGDGMASELATAKAILIGQCATDDERDQILAGTWTWEAGR